MAYRIVTLSIAALLLGFVLLFNSGDGASSSAPSSQPSASRPADEGGSFSGLGK